MTAAERQAALVLVAERILGWEVKLSTPNGPYATASDGSVDRIMWAPDGYRKNDGPFYKYTYLHDLWSPDTSWDDAGMLLEALRDGGFHASILMSRNSFDVEITHDDKVWYGHGASFAAAIFAAALKVAQSMEVQGG